MKTPIELHTELQALVDTLKKDCTKASPPRGMKAGGVRVRAACQQIRQLCLDLRTSVLEYRKNRDTRGLIVKVTPEPDFEEKFEPLPVPEIIESKRVPEVADVKYSGSWFKKYVA